ncbi:hypothetical protein DRQ32_06930 [bacterium]|nr:MAG: hypothetical protein DRQ32_06930 [bacterium]
MNRRRFLSSLAGVAGCVAFALPASRRRNRAQRIGVDLAHPGESRSVELVRRVPPPAAADLEGFVPRFLELPDNVLTVSPGAPLASGWLLAPGQPPPRSKVEVK